MRYVTPISTALLAERTRRGWNQRKAAQFFKVSQPQYQKWEQAINAPGPTYDEKLFEFLRLSQQDAAELLLPPLSVRHGLTWPFGPLLLIPRTHVRMVGARCRTPVTGVCPAPTPTSGGEGCALRVGSVVPVVHRGVKRRCAPCQLSPTAQRNEPAAMQYRRVIVIALGALALAGCSAKVTTGATTTVATTATTGTSATTSPSTTKAAGIPTGSDGSFKFTVTSQQCGQTTLGTDPLTTTASPGTQWCVYGLNVANVKGSAQTFGASNQKALDASNKQLSTDDAAIIYVPSGSASAFSTINPGVSVDVQIVFQLATGDSIKYLELHDSAFSNGVKVNVG